MLAKLLTKRRSRKKWSDGLTDEETFWTNWFRTKGAEWPEDYAWRIDPNAEFQPHIAALVDPERDNKILDVGAGPLTVLGKQLANRRLDITAVDPLADVYDRLIDEAGVTPLVRTQRLDAERLSDRFAPNTFDLTYARNCLDHAYDPAKAIAAMIDVTKPNAVVFLEHLQNEGEHERYQGLHQWNFCAEDGRFIVWKPDWRLDLTERFATRAAIHVEQRDGWVRATIRKR